MTASIKKWRKISPGSAPTAMRNPISRVRSVTETSIMFMMPIPPTTSEIMATQRSSLVIISAVELIVLVISVMSRILKSSGSELRRRCRWRSKELSCSIAGET